MYIFFQNVYKLFKLHIQVRFNKPLWKRNFWFIRCWDNWIFILSFGFLTLWLFTLYLTLNFLGFHNGSSNCLPSLSVIAFIWLLGLVSVWLGKTPRVWEEVDTCWATWKIWVSSILVWVAMESTFDVSLTRESFKNPVWFLSSWNCLDWTKKKEIVWKRNWMCIFKLSRK